MATNGNCFRRMLLNSSVNLILLLELLVPLLLLHLYMPLVIGSEDYAPHHGSDGTTTQRFQFLGASTNLRGIRAALIHRDHVSLRSSRSASGGNKNNNWSPAAEASRSLRRAKSLYERSRRRSLRVLAETAAAPSDSPGPAPVDWETPLSDRSDDEYLMEISLGTPAQTFVAVADTGSDLTWLQCKPCENCFRQSDPLYDPSTSSSYSLLSCSSSACKFLSDFNNCVYSPSAANGTDCQYSYSYGDMSQTTGTLALDTIHVDIVEGGMQSVPSFWFGCSHTALTSSGLYNAADGLVGLGRGQISFPSQLGQYFGNKFSYCLVNRSARAVLSSPLIFGDDALSDSNTSGGSALQFTPLINNPVGGFSTFYYVNLEGISVNGVEASFPADAFTIAANGSGGTFFDSGTTYTSLVSAAFDSLIDAVSSAITGGYEREMTRDFELCYGATWDTWISQYGNQVPSLSFNFANAASGFDLRVASAWFEYDEGIICFAFLRGSHQNIFGNVQQVDYRFVYDLENLRIGFAPAVCETNSQEDIRAQSKSATALLRIPAFDSLSIVSLIIILIHLVLLGYGTSS